jgi:hypothetical protein
VQALLLRQHASAAALLLGKQPQAVFDDDDRAVDDDAEIDRAQAHQVCADLRLDHACDREQHGERDDAGGDEGCPNVAEDQEQYRDDEKRALDEIGLDGRDRGLDEMRAVIDGAGDDALGQGLADLLELCGNASSDGPAVLADQQHGRADDGLVAVARGGAGAQLLAFVDLRDVADAYGNGAARADHDVADLTGIADLAGRAHEILLTVALDIACADIGIVGGERRHHVAEADLVGHQPAGIGQHVKLPLVSTGGIDLDNSGHLAQLRLDDPVLNGPQIAWAERRAAVCLRALLGLHRVQEDLAEAGRDRPHRDFDAGRQLILQLLDALIDKLPGKVDVGAVLEHDGDLAQPVTRERAGVIEPGQAGHRGLDREGDPLLGLQRRIARRMAVDLDLDIGDVGHRIDRQKREIPRAERCNAECEQHDQPALPDRKGEQGVNHDRPRPCPSRPSPQNCFRRRSVRPR